MHACYLGPCFRFPAATWRTYIRFWFVYSDFVVIIYTGPASTTPIMVVPNKDGGKVVEVRPLFKLVIGRATENNFYIIAKFSNKLLCWHTANAHGKKTIGQNEMFLTFISLEITKKIIQFRTYRLGNIMFL